MPRPVREVGEVALHKALTHPLRAQILFALDRNKKLSPSEFSKSSKRQGVSLNTAAYHFRVLAALDAIEIIEEVPRRGSTEHWYAVNPSSPVLGLLRVSVFLQALSAGQGAAAKGDGTDRDALMVFPVEVDARGRDALQTSLSNLKSQLREVTSESKRRSKMLPGGRVEALLIGIAALPSPPVPNVEGRAASGE